jgi:mannose-6-phosphate isomerase
MSELPQKMAELDTVAERQKIDIVSEIIRYVEASGYTIVECDNQKPWGAYVRIDSAQADTFVEEFFPGLSPEEARLGIDNAELSPKLLLVAPGERLSWQRHDRRAERWAFLTPGAYYKSATEEQGELQYAGIGDVVQFEKGECHRLSGMPEGYVVVAEIWQHSDPDNPSDEDDITRLQDDYQR